MEGQLRKLQRVQFEILVEVDRFCERFHLCYSLYAGSCLGAVRHQGFIPWDDDLDICMPRKDYDRFIQLWAKHGPKEYLLQNKENSPLFTQSFTKIRKKHTIFLQDDEELGKYHTGIFIDIFPFDRMPAGGIPKLLFYWRGLKYQLYTRGFIPPKGSFLQRMVSGILLQLAGSDVQGKRDRLLKRLTRYGDNRELPIVFIEIAGSLRVEYPSDLADRYCRVPFEAGEFLCFEHYDDYLTKTYGDYRTLPPENERIWAHHPVVIGFEENDGETGYER